MRKACPGVTLGFGCGGRCGALFGLFCEGGERECSVVVSHAVDDTHTKNIGGAAWPDQDDLIGSS